MTKPTESCSVCEGRSLINLGRIYHPQPTKIAGIDIDLGRFEFYLMRCRNCGFQFKSPAIPAEDLLACYAAAENDHWGIAVDPLQRNFDRFADCVRRLSRGKRILDVGCFNGAFLEYLGDDWQRYGVEPCQGAREVAQQRGVNVLADTLDAIPADAVFDVITAFDVIEHIVDPGPFFESISKHLAPEGIFLASSGDTDALSWKLQKARYWYCSYLPEHVSFFCRQTLDFLASKNQMQSVMHEHMSHKRTSATTRIAESINGFSYAVLLRTAWLGIPRFRTKFAVRAGTAWISATDHFIHVMRRV